MKRLVLLFAALLVAGCGEKSAIEKALEEAVEFESLQERNDLYYQVNTSEPYSGWAKSMRESGQVWNLGRIKDGKKHGPVIVWHKNGQKRWEGTYKDGLADGLWTFWYENGQKKSEETYKDDEWDGPHTSWHENGQKEYEGTRKALRNGRGDFYRIGLATSYFANGQKRHEGTYNKGGDMDGLWTDWDENGQKRAETIYKDSKKISAKYWNSKGEEVATEEEARR